MANNNTGLGQEQTDKQAGRQAGRQTNRQAGRQAGRQTLAKKHERSLHYRRQAGMQTNTQFNCFEISTRNGQVDVSGT